MLSKQSFIGRIVVSLVVLSRVTCPRERDDRRF